MVFGFGKSFRPSEVQDGADPSKLIKPLDVVFVQDTTGSQGPYITSARKAIRDICDKISESSSLSKEQIRFGLIAFRDHPPQDWSYVTKPFGFTNDVEVMQKNLASLIAAGGGDGPEAQTAALAEALQVDWAEGAIKMVVLITDSPPHGLGEKGDGFDKSPDQNDPLEIARQMAERGINLFVIACEPVLSTYKNAVDFYNALTQITSGRIFPLLMADKLGDYIVGSAVETIETEKLIHEFEQVIVDDVYNKDKSVDTVASNLQEYIKSKGIKMNTVVVEDVYNHCPTAMSNVAAWAGSKSVGVARETVKEVTGSRLTAPYAMSSVPLGPMYGTASSKYEDAKELACHSCFEVSPPAPAPAPQPQLMKQNISQSQALRVVLQSVARNSTVTPEGMSSRATGKSISTKGLHDGP